MVKLLSTISLILALVLFPPAALAVISNNAVPGDATYPIKRALEDGIFAAVSLNPVTKAWFAAARSDRRFKEFTTLVTQGKKTGDALNELVEQTQIAASQIANVSDESQKEKLVEQLSQSIEKYDQGLAQLTPIASPQPQVTAQPIPITTTSPALVPTAQPTIQSTSTPAPVVQPTPVPVAQLTPTPTATSVPTPVPALHPSDEERQRQIEEARRKLEEIKRKLEERQKRQEDREESKQERQKEDKREGKEKKEESKDKESEKSRNKKESKE